MAIPLRLLILEDNPSDAELVLHALRHAGYDPIADRVETEQDYREHLKADPEIILADFTMPELEALNALEILQEYDLDIPFIIVSGTIGEERAVQVMQHGASDYIIKDRLGRLGQAVAQALEKKQLRHEARLAERRLSAQYATTKVLAEALNLEAALPQIIEAVCESMGWIWAAVWMVDSADQRLRLAQFWHSPAVDLDEFLTACRTKAYSRGDGLPGGVWAVGESAWIPDVMQDECFSRKAAAARARLHAAFLFPIVAGVEVVGVIEFCSQHIEPRDEKIVGMMTAISTQIGQFIERKRVEGGLRLFRTLIDQTTDGIEVVDPVTGRFLDVNEKTCVSHGYTREEYLSLSVPDVDPQVTSDSWAEVIAARRQPGAQTFESLHRRKDGSTFPVEINLNSIRLDREYLVTVVRDVTERRQLEEQFRQAQKMEAFGQLAGGVAHDFNNLLTIISGYSELLLASLPPEDQSRGPLKEIHRAGEQAASLTRQLLAFSRKQVIQPRVLDLNGVVEGTKKMLGRLIGEDVNLTTVPMPGLEKVKIDPGQVEQVIMNLVVNARDAMPEGGSITIETSNVDLDVSSGQFPAEVKPGRYVLLAVSDSGCGMTDEVKGHLFEPFFTTKEVGKGTGLGLATVFGIVKQSGGHLGVYSEVGQGTTFKVYLPSIVEVEQSQTEARPAPVLTGTETVLLVEDSKAVRAIARMALQENGYTLLEAADGAEALRVSEQHGGPIHLLVSDVVMPRMSGRQLAERLTTLHPAMRVLYVSGYTDDAVVRHGVLQAEVAFLQKPFSMEALQRKVRAVLDREDRASEVAVSPAVAASSIANARTY